MKEHNKGRVHSSYAKGSNEVKGNGVEGNDGPAETVGDSAGKVITVSQEEYEKLVAECLSQEALIEGLVRENGRLGQVVRDKDLEFKAAKATFFDQQEQVNRELNRLRNLVGVEACSPETMGKAQNIIEELPAGGGPILLRKNSDMLRAELDLDATIRSLRERVAIAESNNGAHEKELKQTIDKLRNENRELIEISARNKQTIMAEFLSSQNQLEQNLVALQKENSSLKARLVWYAENQELLETIGRERDVLRVHVNTLRREFLRRGFSASDVEKLLTGGTVADVAVQDDSPIKNDLSDNGGLRDQSVSSVGEYWVGYFACQFIAVV
jgi:uncharacterized protein YukE